MPRILIADDQADVLAALSLLLKGERFQIESAASPEGVLRSIDTHEFDVVLIAAIDSEYAEVVARRLEQHGIARAKISVLAVDFEHLDRCLGKAGFDLESYAFSAA